MKIKWICPKYCAMSIVVCFFLFSVFGQFSSIFGKCDTRISRVLHVCFGSSSSNQRNSANGSFSNGIRRIRKRLVSCRRRLHNKIIMCLLHVLCEHEFYWVDRCAYNVAVEPTPHSSSLCAVCWRACIYMSEYTELLWKTNKRANERDTIKRIITKCAKSTGQQQQQQ